MNISKIKVGSTTYDLKDTEAPRANNAALTGTPTAPTAANGTNSTQIATTAFVMNAFTTNDAMLFKGTIGSSGATVTALPNTHKQGWTYKVATAGTYAGNVCEIGDMIICVTDGTSANNDHWTVVQTNIDGAVIGPSGSVDAHVATFDGTTGKIIKDSGFAIESKAASASGTDLSLVTTGEKATWNGKLNTVAKLGSKTQPLYTSAAGTFAKCNAYAGGTALTLNGTSKSATTAAIYAPTSAGTEGQFLAANANGIPTWVDNPNTDTTYGEATTSVAGLMSSADKTKLDGIATGATANTGTITGITMNGASKGTSGVVDLGTVITSHQDISGKQNKVAKLGSTTKPVYTSAAGTFAECNSYAGGTAVTLNGTSKAASTASLYAPTAAGTAGQVLISSGGTPNWKTGDIIHYVTSPSGTAGTKSHNRTQWTGTVDGVTALYTGLMIMIKIPVAGVNVGVGLDINNLGEHPVILNASTLLSTHYPVGTILPLVYDADQTASLTVNNTSTSYTGCWKISNYDANTTYTVATTSKNGLMSAADKTKLDGIESGALVHIAPTAAEVKSALGTGSGTTKYLREDGTWATPPDTDTNTVTSINGKTGAIAAADIATVLTGAGYKLTDTDTNTTYSAGTGLSLSGTTFALATSGVTAGTYKRVTVDAYGRVTSGDNTDADSWRTVQCNGTSIGSNTLNLKAGSNVSLSNSNGTITISSTDTDTWPTKTSQLTNDSGFLTSSVNFLERKGTLESSSDNMDDLTLGIYEIANPVVLNSAGSWGTHVSFSGGNYGYGLLLFGYTGNELYFRTKSGVGWANWNKVWDSGNLTNLNQLTNGPGYITSSALAGCMQRLGDKTNANDVAVGIAEFHTNPSIANTPGEWGTLASFEGGGTQGYRFQLYGYVGNTLYFRSSSGSFTDNSWKQVAMTSDIPTSMAYGSITYAVNTVTTSGAISLAGTTPLHIVTLNGNASSVALSSNPAVGHSCHVIFYSTVLRTVVIAHDATARVCPGASNITLNIPANGYVEVDFLYDGAKTWVRCA